MTEFLKQVQNTPTFKTGDRIEYSDEDFYKSFIVINVDGPNITLRELYWYERSGIRWLCMFIIACVLFYFA